MPFGFINSVTQYALIALDQQRFLTRAFAIGLAFNVVANVVLISRFGFIAPAYVAIVSELVLFIPFAVGVRRYLAKIQWVQLLWKQALSVVPMAVLFILLPHRQLGAGIVAGLALYATGLGLFRVFDPEEREIVGRVLSPARLKVRLMSALRRVVDPSRPR